MLVQYTNYTACAHLKVFQLLRTARFAKNHVTLVRTEKTHLAELCSLLDILCIRSQALCHAAAAALFGAGKSAEACWSPTYTHHSMLPDVLALQYTSSCTLSMGSRLRRHTVMTEINYRHMCTYQALLDHRTPHHGMQML